MLVSGHQRDFDMLNELLSLEYDNLCDTRGLNCPMPVLRAQKKLNTMQVGQKLCLLTTDQISIVDIPLMCHQHGFQLQNQMLNANLSIFIIER